MECVETYFIISKLGHKPKAITPKPDTFKTFLQPLSLAVPFSNANQLKWSLPFIWKSLVRSTDGRAVGRYSRLRSLYPRWSTNIEKYSRHPVLQSAGPLESAFKIMVIQKKITESKLLFREPFEKRLGNCRNTH